MSTFKPIKLADGNVIPGLGYGVGTAWFNAPADKDGVNRPLVDAVKLALDLKFTHLDNAEAYANEASVGAAIKESGVKREDLFITTKVASGLKDLKKNFAIQLEKLQLDSIDLYLIHWPYDLGKDGFPTHEEAWKQVEELHASGKVKSIGVSNYRVSDLERTLKVAKVKPVVNQIELHPYNYAKAKPLLDYCKKNGITIEAYGPTSPITKFSGGPLDPVLAKVTEAVSKRAGKKVEPSQVLLKLISQWGAVVVTTSGKDWRMKEQLASGEIPDLTAEEIDEIEKAGAQKHQRAFMKHMDSE